MRVVLLSHNARRGDALGHQIAARSRFFHERGDNVHVWIECNRRLHPSLQGSVRTIRDEPPSRLVHDLQGVALLVVHFTHDYPALDVLPLLSSNGPKVVFDYYGVTPPELWDGPAEMLRAGQERRSLVWYADTATVHSRFMRDELCQATGYPPERVHILPLWFQPLLSTVDSSPSLRARLGIRPEARLVLFVGRLARNKRLPVLIEALARLRCEDPSFHLLVVGDNREVYQREFEHCRHLAKLREIADRVHWLGHVADETLASAYREADVLVVPSRHEGCNLPVLEAMGAGVPVIVARSSALPETLNGAGLTFEPDDAEDLARQLCRVLSIPAMASQQHAHRRVAVVSPRFGQEVVGGAERSLYLVAQHLSMNGHTVEVFTTGRVTKSPTGVAVHTFDRVAPESQGWPAISHRLELGENVWSDFVHATRWSDTLLAEWRRRANEFDACIVGPSSCGLTWLVAAIRPDRTLLLPCFHDEPLARFPQIRRACQSVGGILYHSDTERRFAEQQLGIHHPNGVVIGTYLAPSRGNVERGRRRVRTSRPYLLYSGRLAKEKNFSLLRQWFQRYRSECGPQLDLVLTGEAPAGVLEPGVISLGRLDDETLADVTAAARCLVQLSARESLSLVALNAWNQGVPVLAHRDCAVLYEWIRETQSGETVRNYEEFRHALEDLLKNPTLWAERGRRGLDAVRSRFSSPTPFVNALQSAMDGLTRPLAETMRQRGRAVIAQRGADSWRHGLEQIVRHVMDLPPRATPEIRAELEWLTRIPSASNRRWLTVRVTNRGSVPLWPHSTRWICKSARSSSLDQVLPWDHVLNPGESRVVRLTLPYEYSSTQLARLCLMVGDRTIASCQCEASVRTEPSPSSSKPSEDLWMRSLNELVTLSALPTGYVDVSEGFLAGIKRWIKRKLLGQFQTAYVDVLARQQAAFNRTVVDILRQLSEEVMLLSQQPGDNTAALNAVAEVRKRLDILHRQMQALTNRSDEWVGHAVGEPDSADPEETD